MSVGVIIAIAGLVLAILVHAFATIWWASKITGAVENLNTNLHRIDKELEKRDDQISALWKRVDELRDMIPTVK